MCCWCQCIKMMEEALDKTALKWGTKSFVYFYTSFWLQESLSYPKILKIWKICVTVLLLLTWSAVFLPVELVGSVGWVMVASLGVLGKQGSCLCLLPTGCHSDPWSLWRRGSSPGWQTVGWWSDSRGKWHSLCLCLVVEPCFQFNRGPLQVE